MSKALWLLILISSISIKEVQRLGGPGDKLSRSMPGDGQLKVKVKKVKKFRDVHTMLQEQGPGRRDEVGGKQIYPEGHPNNEGWDWTNEGEHEKRHQNDDWWPEEQWPQRQHDKGEPFKMGDQDCSARSSTEHFVRFSSSRSSRSWGRSTQGSNVVGSEETRGKRSSSHSGHSDPQNGHYAGGMGCAEPDQGKLEAQRSESAQ